jgi:hypothetical protein
VRGGESGASDNRIKVALRGPYTIGGGEECVNVVGPWRVQPSDPESEQGGGEAVSTLSTTHISIVPKNKREMRIVAIASRVNAVFES